MKNSISRSMNLRTEDLLDRNQMKSVTGGALQEGGCKLAIRNSDGSFAYWTDDTFSVSQAQNSYNAKLEFNDGSYVSGYCCASC